MSGRTAVAIFSPLILAFFTGSSLLAQQSANEIYQSLLREYDPLLLRLAEDKGLYDREKFPVWRDINPFYLRGDFNGDGEMDVAFWVRETESDLRGVAIVHSSLDTLYLFGAGRPRPPGGIQSNQIRVDAWHLLLSGHTEHHISGDIPEIGVVDGGPFTFERETLEFVHLGRSAFVFHWAKGKYWEFWTAD